MARILSVDDSATVLASIKMILENRSFTVVTVNRPEEALKLLTTTREKFDLIITDLNMPVMSGIELIKKLRTLPPYKFTPIIILTTESQEAKKEEARKAGATAWITKPVTPEQLTAVVQKLLR